MFTNEAAYLYLLKKPNCTKYYLVFSIGSPERQRDMIDRLKNVQIIITSEIDDKGHPKYKLPLVKKYINEKYSVLYQEDIISSRRNKRVILRKN